MNAVEIEAAISELADQPFDAQEFPYAFLAAFGNKETTLKRLRAGNNNASDVPGGAINAVLLRNNIHIATCEAGQISATLADLYDPKSDEGGMPANLRAAHEHNDETLERIYIGRRFKHDTERLEKLFELYTKMTAASKGKPMAKAKAPKLALDAQQI